MTENNKKPITTARIKALVEKTEIKAQVPFFLVESIDQITQLTGIVLDDIVTLALHRYLPEILGDVVALDNLTGANQLPGKLNI